MFRAGHVCNSECNAMAFTMGHRAGCSFIFSDMPVSMNYFLSGFRGIKLLTCVSLLVRLSNFLRAKPG